jgi:structure-specific recognition protein 1|uniref:HMG box domain-containing protein n=2 Tax=Panagrolaimus TaxID=55784 RepID=A0A914P2H0_9BILA
MARERGVAKKAKDPNAPKRALTAYFIWLQENREAIKKPGMSATQVAKAAGALWRELSDKSKWEKKAEEDKKRYERENAEYKNSA